MLEIMAGLSILAVAVISYLFGSQRKANSQLKEQIKRKAEIEHAIEKAKEETQEADLQSLIDKFNRHRKGDD